MIQKEFYFIRHGQTDHNISQAKDKGDHLPETPLNAMGRAQAMSIEPIIASLPIQTVCASPMKRVQETKEIVTARLDVPHHEIEELGECSANIWQAMRDHGMYSQLPSDDRARPFMDRVRAGMNQALSLPGPSLIIAHGGVHWAICCLIGITDHEWAVQNCAVVHFSIDEQGKWRAFKLA